MVSEQRSQRWWRRGRRRFIGAALVLAAVLALVVWEETVKFEVKQRIWTWRRTAARISEWRRIPGTLQQSSQLLLARLESGSTEHCICLRLLRRWYRRLKRGLVRQKHVRHVNAENTVCGCPTVRAVIEVLLLIGGVEPNPGPTPVGPSKPRRIEQWTIWNVSEAFRYAAVGADVSFAARVERLLKLCCPESLAASNLCEEYQRVSNELVQSRKRAGDAAASQLDDEKF